MWWIKNCNNKYKCTHSNSIYGWNITWCNWIVIAMYIHCVWSLSVSLLNHPQWPHCFIIMWQFDKLLVSELLVYLNCHIYFIIMWQFDKLLVSELLVYLNCHISFIIMWQFYKYFPSYCFHCHRKYNLTLFCHMVYLNECSLSRCSFSLSW